MSHCYYNNFTGEVYNSHSHMLKSVFSDFIHYKSARKLALFTSVRKIANKKEEE